MPPKNRRLFLIETLPSTFTNVKCLDLTAPLYWPVVGGHTTVPTAPPPTTTTPPVTTKRLLVEVTVPNPRGPAVPIALDDSAVLLYSLVGLCMALLLSSLSLALVVFLRKARPKTSNPGPKKPNHNHKERVVQAGQEVGQPRSQPGRRSKG